MGLTSSESESCACAAPGLLAIDGVRILARHGRHTERQGVDVDGGTMSFDCAAALVELDAECDALAAADVDVVAECETLAPWTPMSVADRSTPRLTSTGSTDGLENRILFCLRREAARDRSDDIRSEEHVVQSWNSHSTLAARHIDCDEVPRNTTRAKSGGNVRRRSQRPHDQCLGRPCERRWTHRARTERDTVPERCQRPLHHRQRAELANSHIHTCSA